MSSKQNKTKKNSQIRNCWFAKKPLEPFTLLPSPITLSVPEFSNLTFFLQILVHLWKKKEMAMTGYYIAAKTSLSRSSELITLGAGLTGVMTAYCRPSWYIGGVHYSVPESTGCLWWKYPFSTLKILWPNTKGQFQLQ